MCKICDKESKETRDLRMDESLGAPELGGLFSDYSFASGCSHRNAMGSTALAWMHTDFHGWLHGHPVTASVNEVNEAKELHFENNHKQCCKLKPQKT